MMDGDDKHDPLAALRAEIDAIDEELVALLERRFGVARRVAAVKRRTGIPVRVPDRIAAVIRRVAARAAERGLDPELLRTIYREVIEATCRAEEALVGPDSPRE